MRILHVYKDYYPPVKGGIEGHIHLLANGLQARRFQVQVLVSNTRARLVRERVGGIAVTKVPELGRVSSAPLNLTLPGWIGRMGRQADLIHFHFPNPTAEASYLLAGCRRPAVVSYHSDIVRQAFLGKLYRPFLMRFLQRAAAIFVASPNYLDSSPVLARYRAKCRVIPYGVDLQRFALPDAQRAAVAGVRAAFGPRIVMFIGRFRYYKGLNVLVEAMRRVDARLLLVGTGPMEPELRRQVDHLQLGGRVVFLGELTDAQMAVHLHACDLFVLPSNRRSEAFGIVQLEAMACGKPVVSTEIGTGTSFVNRHMETGLVVPPDDAGALAVAVNRLLDDEPLRRRFGRASLQRVRSHFLADAMVAKVAEAYGEVLGAGTAGA